MSHLDWHEVLVRRTPLSAADIGSVEAGVKQIVGPYLDRIPMELLIHFEFLAGGHEPSDSGLARKHTLTHDMTGSIDWHNLEGVRGVFDPIYVEAHEGRYDRHVWGLGKNGKFLCLTTKVYGYRQDGCGPFRENAEKATIQEVSLATLLEGLPGLTCFQVVSVISQRVSTWSQRRQEEAAAAARTALMMEEMASRLCFIGR